jgi:hypothetical protein
MKSPPKKKAPGELASKAGRKLLTDPTKYHALHLLQGPARFLFWRIEQAKARIQDRIENERRRE